MAKPKYVEVEESAVYDNYLHQKNYDDVATLDTFLNDGEEVLEDDPDKDVENWKSHWKQMPEFIQEDNPAFKTLIVRFRNEEDYKEFSKMIAQNLTLKSKSIWHPALDRSGNMLTRWIEKEEK